MKFLISFFLAFWLLCAPSLTQARVTPEDIVNAKKDEYNTRVKNYSSQSKQRLEAASQKIADFNKTKTDELSQIMERQGEILDEYVSRNNLSETEGIKNARYWLTFAHEAVAYQAAKIYIFNLTGETNIKSDTNSQINILQSDLNTLKGKVVKSQNIIADLVAK